MREVIEYPEPDVSIVNHAECSWERKRQAVRELLPELRAKYDGQYVAIKDGKAVARGLDRMTVGLEACARVGYGPPYLGQVSDSPHAPVRIPSARRPRGQDSS